MFIPIPFTTSSPMWFDLLLIFLAICVIVPWWEKSRRNLRQHEAEQAALNRRVDEQWASVERFQAWREEQRKQPPKRTVWTPGDDR